RAPEPVRYPVLLDDLPVPQLRAYPKYTVVAEKLHAICLLGMANSRMKDYFDLWVLLTEERPALAELRGAVEATFARRKLAMPADLPVGLATPSRKMRSNKDNGRRSCGRTDWRRWNWLMSSSECAMRSRGCNRRDRSRPATKPLPIATSSSQTSHGQAPRPYRPASHNPARSADKRQYGPVADAVPPGT